MSSIELKTLIFFIAGTALLLVGFVGGGLTWFATANAGNDGTSQGLAWVLWSPLFLGGVYFLILAGASP